MIKIILYDLDGVLVDACHWHYIALNEALDEVCGFKIEEDEHKETFNGLPTKIKLEILESQGRLNSKSFKRIWDKKQELTLKVINENAKLAESKVELHKTTSGMGIISACVTNSIRETALLMLQKTSQIDFMNFVIANDDVKNAKPYAEPYLRAMVKLQSMPENTLIIEDSDKGYQAAIQTGSKVVRVKNATEVTKSLILKALKSDS